MQCNRPFCDQLFEYIQQQGLLLISEPGFRLARVL